MKRNEVGIARPFFDPAIDVAARRQPGLSQFDYIVLQDLSAAIGRVADSLTGKLLDYGCGAKPYEPLFRRCLSYEGADFSENLFARWPIGEDGALPTELTSAFDAVLSFQVLEHVPDVSLYLEECRRVLSPGGGIVLTTHGIWEYHPGPCDRQRWTMEGLTSAVEAHGFATVHAEAVTVKFRSLLQQLQILLRGRRFVGGPASIAAINLLAALFQRQSAATSDERSLAICYLYHGKRK